MFLYELYIGERTKGLKFDHRILFDVLTPVFLFSIHYRDDFQYLQASVFDVFVGVKRRRSRGNHVVDNYRSIAWSNVSFDKPL